jgi:hypothetical protein
MPIVRVCYATDAALKSRRWRDGASVVAISQRSRVEFASIMAREVRMKALDEAPAWKLTPSGPPHPQHQSAPDQGTALRTADIRPA